jgi:prepilin-type N-terminal cleavage/methylation domain-containing protein
MKINSILRKSNKNGFSLIELMVVVVILSLIVLGLVTFFTGGARSWIAGQSQIEAQRNARQAMDIMVRQIREANKIYSTSRSSEIYFHTPFDGDISFSLLGRDLKRINNIMISNVQGLIFTYLDNSGSTVDPTDSDKESKVSKVHINLQVDVDQDNNPDITLNSDIDLRNFDL